MVSLNSVFYGGTQVPNPSNIVSISGTPTTKTPNTRLGYLAVNSGIMYGLVSQSGGSNTWAILGGGSSAVATLTGNSGGAISPSSGNINTLGTGSITIVGSGSTLTTQLTGLTNHALLVGAGTATITKLALGSSGQLLTSGGASADPAWTTATFPATATGTGTILRSDGTNWVASTATYPNTVVAGDVLIGTAANVIGSLADVAVGQVLMSGGVGVAPAYSESPSVSGSLTAATTVTATLGAITATNGNVVLGTAGNKIVIATGANASVGTSDAMAGTPGVVVVATTACSATAKVFYSRATTGGTPGEVSITAQDGTGFTLTSTANETSTFNWWIINA